MDRAGPTRVEVPMARSGSAKIVLVALLACAGCGRRTVDKSLQAELGHPDVVPGLIDVQLRGIDPQRRLAIGQLGALVEVDELRDESLLGLIERDIAEHVVLKVDPKKAAEVLAALRARDDVVYAEPVVKLQAYWMPNDPQFEKQWHLKAAGAPKAWDGARGRGVTVAVIDTGVTALDDLDAARVLKGKSFVPGTPEAKDDHGHGTHVAGTIAQSTGNGVGVAGMAPEAKILPVKVLSADGFGNSAAISDAIRWAADHGAKVLNLSLGGGARSAAMADAVAYARRRGALVVCAAGNSGHRGVSYPAAYPGALAVSAVGPKGALAPYSSFGPEIRIAAPGGDKSLGEESGVLQETIDGQSSDKGTYKWFQGTSMATPHVAGAAALIASMGITNPDAIEGLLTATASSPAADAISGPAAERYGAGLLDAGAAVNRVALWHGLSRLALAAIGAWFALAHARRLQQIRAREGMPGAFWGALVIGSGALVALAPVGLARLPLSHFIVTPLAGMGAHFVGLPHASLLGSIAALIGWSALAPFVLAMFARAAGFRGGSQGLLAPLAAGLAFGWAGLLLQAALFRSVYLPWIPGFFTPVWLAVSAVIAWGAGRGLLAGRTLR
jgi:serine protease